MKHVFLLLSVFSLISIADSTDPREVCGPGEYLPVDCRPHVGECYNSCSDHRYCAVVNEERCSTEANPYEVDCFCKVGSRDDQ